MLARAAKIPAGPNACAQPTMVTCGHMWQSLPLCPSNPPPAPSRDTAPLSTPTGLAAPLAAPSPAPPPRSCTVRGTSWPRTRSTTPTSAACPTPRWVVRCTQLHMHACRLLLRILSLSDRKRSLRYTRVDTGGRRGSGGVGSEGLGQYAASAAACTLQASCLMSTLLCR